VFTSTGIVQPSPQLNCVSGGITLSNLVAHSQTLCHPTYQYLHSVLTLHYNSYFTSRIDLYSDYMIISCSWHGATSARVWHTSCSYPKMCHNNLCPLFQECCIHVFYCVVNLLWDSCNLCGRNCDYLNGPTEQK
jgi:hypothetical protein